jgi:glycine/D-amino acid oxidase-like deaminating enzyme
MKARIAIVGGGVMGVAIALEAALRARQGEESVVLLERTTLAAGSSGRSGAILRQHYSQRVVAAMARDSLRAYAGFHARTGRWIGFQRCGVLTIAGPAQPEEVALVERNIEMQRSIGIDTRRIEAREIRALVPGISVDDGAIAAYEPGGGFVDPVRTVEAFAALARTRGAITRLGVAATGFAVERGRVRGVRTEEGLVEAEQVVVAAGPWTRRLLLTAGIDLPLTAVRPEQHFLAMPGPTAAGGRALGLEPSFEQAPLPPQVDADPRFSVDAEGEPPAAHPVLLDLEHGFYTRCEPGSGRTRVGKMDYHGAEVLEDPDLLDEQVRPGFVRWAREALAARLPVYERQRDAGSLAGWYTLTPDAQAIIGAVPQVEGLLVVSGFSGHGFKLAPSIGEGVAQLLFGEPVTAFEPEFFSPLRFAGAQAPSSAKAFGL